MPNSPHGNSTHGASKTRLFKIWIGMKTRCTNPRRATFRYYGGRGIRVCEEWQRFEPFRDWALANGYADHFSIDRIDNDGNYEPGNCRWVAFDKQMQNTSHIRPVIRSDGKRFNSVIDAAHDTGCTAGNIVEACQGKHKIIHGYGWRYA